MGKNSVPGKGKPDQRTFSHVARAIAAAGILAAAVCAVNLSAGSLDTGLLAGAVVKAGAGPGAAAPARASGTGSVPQPHAAGSPPSSDQLVASALPPAILSDPQAALAFPHTSIGGFGQDGSLLAVGTAAAGRPLAGFLMSPLQFLDPSSPFGFRVSPISGAAGDFHLGQDFAAACGTPVYAADSGVVRAAGWHPWGGGNRIEIDHGDGLITTYNHLESIGVHTGDRVQAGQAIARVGTTGWSTGCHLHFESILNGRYTNPMRWSFLQLRALNQPLADLVSYAPGQGLSAGMISWTIPLQVDTSSGFPAAGLQMSPFPAVLPPAPAPLPWEATGAMLPPPGVQLTTTDQPPAQPSASAVPPSSGPAPSDPAPSLTDTASPSPSTAPPASTDPVSPSPSPTSSPTPTPTPSPTPTAPAPTDPVATDPVSPSPTDSATPLPTAPAPAPVPTAVEPVPTPTMAAPAPAPAPEPTTAPAPTTSAPAPAPAPSPTALTPVPPAVEPTPAPTASEPAATTPPA